MKDEPFQVIVEQLTLLSEKQKSELMARLRALNVKEVGLGPQSQNHDDWLLAGIAYEAHRRGKIARPDVRLFNHFPTLPAYKKKAVDAKAIILRGFGIKPDSALLDAAGRIVARCLFDHLKNKEPFVVIASVDRVGEVIEACFPGYMESGLLQVVLQSGMIGK